MSRVVIVGGGFAGVWSAAAAARLRDEAGTAADDLEIMLIAPGPDMVIRPRLYEADPGKRRVELARILGPIDVDHLPATVTGIDPVRRELTAVTADGHHSIELFDRVIVAAGSQLRRPDAHLPQKQRLFDVDTLPAAVALDEHLHTLPEQSASPGRFTAVVIGAGFVGLEIATELVGRLREIARPCGAVEEVRVVLVERASDIGPELGVGPRPVILQALADLKIETRTLVTVTEVAAESVMLSDSTVIDARTVVWTAGMSANPLTASLAVAHDALGRLPVDHTLRVSGEHTQAVFAAGDTAAALVDPQHHTLQSCQHAHVMGRFAGHNAVADLLGLPLADFDPAPYVTCLDLGGAGAIFTEGWERTVRLTGEPAKGLKREINHLIRPPLDDRNIILGAADYRTVARGPGPRTTDEPQLSPAR
ncbi:FAD-dependent oxidoreductase [Streptomyces sp. NBC_01643]|uniref:NAD(P)/FAD-dependent oxidoreductase n=1 Tax=Streptomyces sp. NBC_01643 TaxID=2975906 RepID=UPI002F912168|nr:FAD-dependent oxidoreductase [Streptomyces sp. NBC_01643]